MRNIYSRHLVHLLKQKGIGDVEMFAAEASIGEDKVVIPPEFNAKDWLSFLLHVDAELEQGLMVQYLYAAYSMGGDHINERYRERVRGWQEILLGISKEEMGHFVSIQNVLRVIGAPLNFDRQSYPWKPELSPFAFELEPLTLKSLAKYIYAESPEGWFDEGDENENVTIEGVKAINVNGVNMLNLKKEDINTQDIKVEHIDEETKKIIKEEIKKLIREGLLKHLNEDELGIPISVLFTEVLKIIKDDKLINDDVFLPETYPYQAKFDEWGRGYAEGARGNSTKRNIKGAPDVLVMPLLSRTDAISALEEIAEQGEATSVEQNQLSHFERFLGIYIEWRVIEIVTGEKLNPTRNVAINPTVPQFEIDPSSFSEESSVEQQIDIITNPLAIDWANLFNVRYRMLLTFLIHSFLLDEGFNKSGAFTPRGTIIHATFGEMYNLRSIANVLVKTRLKKDSDNSDKMAGPPFSMPYTMDIPTGEISRWRMHQDLLDASAKLIDTLLNTADESDHKYLYSLKEADDKLNKLAEKITAVTI